MATPAFESLCCLLSSTKFSRSLILNFDPLPYNLVSLFASLFSMIGSGSQLKNLCSNRSVREKFQNISLRTRGRSILKCLALADCAAALGILIRSLIWIKFNSFGALEDVDLLEKGLCIILSVWIHYFFTATYIWTFIYALDVYFGLRSVKFNPRMYHLFGWLSPLILCLAGTLTLYLPDLNCSSNYLNPLVRFLPNYLSTFVPIVFVMVANPLLYITSFASVEKLVISSSGRLTHRERNIIDGLKMKFMLINMVFFCCWVPNVANGIVLWSGWQRVSRSLVYTIWYLMAILNPLQAVLNCLVYRSWAPPHTTHVVRPSPFSLKDKILSVSFRKRQNIGHEASNEQVHCYVDDERFVPEYELSSSSSSSAKETVCENTPLLL